MSTQRPRRTNANSRLDHDVLDLLRENNPAPVQDTGLDFRAQTDLDRILIGDLVPRTDPDTDQNLDLTSRGRGRGRRPPARLPGSTGRPRR